MLVAYRLNMLVFPLCLFLMLHVINCELLLSTIVIHRHGDRNPLRTYATDPYVDELHWPEGLGQLTKRGMQRQHDLGVWLRQRYSSFLPSKYSPNFLRVVSTDVDRTLTSAAVTLAGLYPPKSDEKFNSEINWRPIPIHTVPKELDAKLAMKKPCKKYEKLVDDVMASEQMQKFNYNYRNLYWFLQNHTGEQMNNIFDVEVIYNALITEKLAGKQLPDWSMEIFPEKIQPAVLLRYKIPCSTKELARLRTGLFFGDLVKHFDSIVNNEKIPRFLLFSGHDSTLSDILTTLGTFDDQVPSYSSAILIELHENLGEFYVNLLFKNDSGLFDFTVKGCNFNCGLVTFRDILKPVLVESLQQWESECKID